MCVVKTRSVPLLGVNVVVNAIVDVDSRLTSKSLDRFVELISTKTNICQYVLLVNDITILSQQSSLSSSSSSSSSSLLSSLLLSSLSTLLSSFLSSLFVNGAVLVVAVDLQNTAGQSRTTISHTDSVPNLIVIVFVRVVVNIYLLHIVDGMTKTRRGGTTPSFCLNSTRVIL
jgi:hypothetical protein